MINSVTLQRLRVLEQLYERGYQDEVVDLTVGKLVDRQIQKDESQLASLAADLQTFERQHGMASADFAARYGAGKAGDSADAFEWHALYKMYVRLTEHLGLLKTQG
ncbi:MAG: hypothetical protein KBG20_14560 [Caldilineaceae bacterium]|nr:hypothetical protein [Caldilineaceae bacterium]MBP9073525.1 hypothetical protein [Caldilineaceae bacterium]